jgi:hypothetical protein
LPKQGQKSITLRADTVAALKALYNGDRKRPLNQSFTSYVHNVLLEHIEHSRKMQAYGNFLEYINARDNEIFLQDNRKNETVTVWVDGANKALICRTDKSDSCIHVGFCYAVREVYDILIDAGFKPPKVAG